MKPMIILPPDAMSEENIKLLRENDICVVVAKNPAAVKFVDPIPAVSSRTQIENAAIQLSRCLVTYTAKGLSRGYSYPLSQAEVTRMYVEFLVNGTPLDARGSTEEQEQEIFDAAKMDEIRRLAREEAKAERAKNREVIAEKAKTP